MENFIDTLTVKVETKETKETKESQRALLHKTIWSAANDLRGSVDGWDFKMYVMGTLFYRYLSEKLEYDINSADPSGETVYRAMSKEDVDDEIKEQIFNLCGWFLYPEELFCNVVAACEENENINTDLQNTLNAIVERTKGTFAENCFKGIFSDFDVNSVKLGNTNKEKKEKICKLLKTIDSLDLGTFDNHTIDTFGDTYEYLMGMYAANGGKSGGEYYTPQEVSTLLAKLVTLNNKDVASVYDPTCGSGSLLLKIGKEVNHKDELKYYGQEINNTTHNLALINMCLHGVAAQNCCIECGDTLLDDRFAKNGEYSDDRDTEFDVIVGNMPYSIPWKSYDESLLLQDPRFAESGVIAPKKKADFAFIQHSLHHLKNNGKMAMVCFPGIMYRGSKEQKIREWLIKQGYVEAVISLPADIFFGTPIATDIMVLSKNRFGHNGVKFIDASNEFIRADAKNKLSDENIANIAKYFEGKEDIRYVTYTATEEEIASKKYDLSPSKYIEKKDGEEVIDIEALMSELDETIARNKSLDDEIRNLVANF